mgnify:CR=1 FL=1
MINGDTEIVATDIETFNGVIHVIDSVILPPEDIVDIASAAGSFNTLVAAVKAAGLADALMGEGPFTVFAPTDEAFAKLPAGTIDSLLREENRGGQESGDKVRGEAKTGGEEEGFGEARLARRFSLSERPP